MEDIKIIIETLNFSNMTWQILTPIIFSICDIITGFIQAIINKNVDSTKMRTGLLHKILILVILILSFVLDATFSLSICSKIVSIYIIVMEITSIIENITKAGINIGKLTEILNIWKGSENENEEK